VSAGERSGAVSAGEDHFDICGPLPTGTTLLEASAGTGKTWTIGALVTRYVAEGHALLEQMLVVTFGRAASQELRERVRSQLVEAERALAGDVVTTDEPRSELVDLLLDCDDAERRLRHRRVSEALAGFDAATIATTHQFCSMVLDSLGVAGDTDSSARLVEDLDDLLGEVVDDLYLRAFARVEDAPAFSHAEALAIARTAVGDPQARLEPAGEDPQTVPGRRVAAPRDGPPQAPARHPLLRRPAQPARRRAGGRRRPGPGADAAALADRAGRRVPGHRSGAVGGARPGVQRARDDGPHR
jgi:exodeoxyribonuclease V beta subunit